MAATSLTPAQTRTQAVGFVAECSLAGLRQALTLEVADPLPTHPPPPSVVIVPPMPTEAGKSSKT